MWTENSQRFKLDLEKVEEPEIKLPTSVRSSKKQDNSGKSSAHWLCQSLWLCGSQQTGKSLKRWEYQTTLPASWEICMQIKKQQLEPDMEQWTDSKSGKQYVKAVYFTLLISLICRVHHVKCQARWSTSWNQDRWGKMSITSDMQMTPPLQQKVKRN